VSVPYPAVFIAQCREGGIGISTHRRDSHQTGQIQRPGVGDLRADPVHRGMVGDVHSTAGRVAVEADLHENP
jgi:hypothetical protein